MEKDTNKNLNSIIYNNSANLVEIDFFPPNYTQHKSNFLKLKDTDIYYEVLGEGPALIFIHGLGGKSYFMVAAGSLFWQIDINVLTFLIEDSHIQKIILIGLVMEFLPKIYLL